MSFHANMRSFKQFGTVKRQMFLTGLISLSTIAFAANLLSKRHTETYSATSSREIESHETGHNKDIMYFLKQNQKSNKEVAQETVTQNPAFSYHAPNNELYERANDLVKSNLLVIPDQKSKENAIDFMAPLNSKSSLSPEAAKFSKKQRLSAQLTNAKDYESHLSSSEDDLSGWLEDDSQDLPHQEDLEETLRPLSEENRWRSWPECLCGPQKGAECTRFLEPAESRHLPHGAGGSCSWRAWQESGERVISTSLFGPRATHDYHLHNLVNASRVHYPGWSVWVYLRHPNPTELCPLLHSAPHVFFCDTRVVPALGDLKRTSPYIWRVSPLGDPRVKKLFVRNLNSSPIEREAAAVKEWLASNKTWHVMRDHPTQSSHVPGGQWGAQWGADTATNMAAVRHILLTRIIPSFTADQTNKFVSGALWSKMLRGGLMQHDAYLCQSAPEGSFRPWPTRRVGNTYVGIKGEPATAKVPDCPVECRPPNHQDWLTC